MMMANDGQRIADAIKDALTIDEDDHGRDTNAVDALRSIARALTLLGNADAATPMGALEALGVSIVEGNQKIADALSDVASALNEVADAIRERGAQ